jgi:serine/threonine protein kinase
MVLLQLLLAIDLITKLLTIDSQKRITTAEALNHPWMKVE